MSEVFVARQPIFDRRMKVAGYELLFRGGPTSEAFVINPEGATASVVLNAFTEIGLERIVGSHPASARAPNRLRRHAQLPAAALHQLRVLRTAL
jgi:c-di-GMP phosphodiesterase